MWAKVDKHICTHYRNTYMHAMLMHSMLVYRCSSLSMTVLAFATVDRRPLWMALASRRALSTPDSMNAEGLFICPLSPRHMMSLSRSRFASSYAAGLRCANNMNLLHDPSSQPASTIVSHQ